MSKELEALKEKVKNKLIEAGFTCDDKYGSQNYHIGNEWQRIYDEKWDYYRHDGFQLYVEEVHRSNAATENTSLRIWACEVHNSSCHGFYSVKFSYKDSVKKQDRLIEEIITAYKDKVKDLI